MISACLYMYMYNSLTRIYIYIYMYIYIYIYVFIYVSVRIAVETWFEVSFPGTQLTMNFSQKHGLWKPGIGA